MTPIHTPKNTINRRDFLTVACVTTLGITFAGCGSGKKKSINRKTSTGLLLESLGGSGRATGVSSDGRIIVGTDGRDAFRWTEEGGTDNIQGFKPLDNSILSCVSMDGTIIIGGKAASDHSAHEAFRWTKETGVILLKDTIKTFESNAAWISQDSKVIVGIINNADPNTRQLDPNTRQNPEIIATTRDAFRWTQETGVVRLGKLNPTKFNATEKPLAASSNGNVIVGESRFSADVNYNGSQQEAFRWTKETGTVGLGKLRVGDMSSALGVSSDGKIVVGVSGAGNNQQEAFRWTAETGMVSLGALSYSYYGDSYGSIAFVGLDGNTIIFANAYTASTPYIWTPQKGMRSLTDVLTQAGLDLSDLFFTSLTAMSEDGKTLVGSAGFQTGSRDIRPMRLYSPTGFANL
jgi:probable HAF family extracellular repeat protein